MLKWILRSILNISLRPDSQLQPTPTPTIIYSNLTIFQPYSMPMRVPPTQILLIHSYSYISTSKHAHTTNRRDFRLWLRFNYLIWLDRIIWSNKELFNNSNFSYYKNTQGCIQQSRISSNWEVSKFGSTYHLISGILNVETQTNEYERKTCCIKRPLNLYQISELHLINLSYIPAVGSEFRINGNLNIGHYVEYDTGDILK